MLGILAQAPVFMLFYFTLKGLTEHNVNHMDQGGALWFTDLTIPDPYYVLSLATAATFILAIEVCFLLSSLSSLLSSLSAGALSLIV